MRSWSVMGAESPFTKVSINKSILSKVCRVGNATDILNEERNKHGLSVR